MRASGPGGAESAAQRALRAHEAGSCPSRSSEPDQQERRRSDLSGVESRWRMRRRGARAHSPRLCGGFGRRSLSRRLRSDIELQLRGGSLGALGRSVVGGGCWTQRTPSCIEAHLIRREALGHRRKARQRQTQSHEQPKADTHARCQRSRSNALDRERDEDHDRDVRGGLQELASEQRSHRDSPCSSSSNARKRASSASLSLVSLRKKASMGLFSASPARRMRSLLACRSHARFVNAGL